MASPVLLEFLSVAIVHLLAVSSPGPDFAIVVRNSVLFGRAAGRATAVGVGIGIFVHVAYCLLGLGILISKSILIFTIVKLCGAAYLIWIGAKALRATPGSLPTAQQQGDSALPSWHSALKMGFVTNALNPKATLFFLALFSVTIDPQRGAEMKILYGVYLAAATTLWFSVIAIFFSQRSVREVFTRLGHWFERVMGAVLIALGLKLAAAHAN